METAQSSQCHNFNRGTFNQNNHFEVNNVMSQKIDALVLNMNATVDYAQDVAARFGELEKSLSIIGTSLAKLESALNTDTSGKIGDPARLFGPQNDHESAMCKGIHKSIPTQNNDHISDELLFCDTNDDISDEDDENNLFDHDTKDIKPLNYCVQSNSVQMMKCKIDTKDYSNEMEIFTSNYRRVTPSKGPGNFYSVPRLTNVGIEQFQTPLAMHIPMSIPKLKSHTSLSHNDRHRRHYVTMKEHASDSKALFASKFPPTRDMRLTHAETKVCAYVFHPDSNPSGILRIRNTIATKRDIECLCPGREIVDKIIEIMALKTTWTQLHHIKLHQITSQTVWSLPPSFADDVLRGQSVNKLLKDYAVHWMLPFSSLKYIYLPIKEEGHWYLVVVSLEERVIHNLDSCLLVEHVTRRHNIIRTMCSVLHQMISSEYFPHDYLSSIHRIRWWEILDTKGISNCKQSDNSAVWVLQWMKMEHCFQSNLVVSVLDEKVVRMRTAMDLLLCSHNEYKERLEAEAQSFWNTLKLLGAR